jgi:hypothetical protein
MVPRSISLPAAVLAAALAASRTARSEQGPFPQRQVEAARVEPGAVRVDGEGNDPAWRGAPSQGGFVQYHPRDGASPTEPTDVALAYDDEALYVLVEARDTRPGEIRALLTRRDGASSSDWIHVWFDTLDDRRTAYRFSVNPRGVKQDARVSNDGEEDASWDAVWEARTRTHARGWTAELRIPFSQVRYVSDRATWGLQVGRLLSRLNETSYWRRVPKDSSRFVRHFGRLGPLRALPAPRRLELVPYVTGSFTRQTNERTFWDANAGVDGRVGLGSWATLDLTINPDFGQVEADPSELNLTGLETYFPEKRRFFLEGIEILRFPLAWGDGDQANETLFYSRRVGRAPRRDLGLPDEQIVRYPKQTPIVSATKLTGKTADGLSIGWLHALSASAHADVLVDGGAAREIVEPMAAMNVARVTKDLRGGQTVVGAMATFVERQLGQGYHTEFTKDALAGGADLDHRAGDWALLARAYGTNVRGSREAIATRQRSSVHYYQRPDAPHLGVDEARTSLGGWGVTSVAGKLSGRPFRGAAGTFVRSPGLDPNDLGYLRAADEQTAWLWLQGRDDDPGAIHQRYQVNLNGWGSRTFGGELQSLGGNVNTSVVFANYMRAWTGVSRNQAALDPRALRGGPALLVPGRTYGWLGGATDDRKDGVLELEGSGSRADEGDIWGLGVWARATLRPVSSVELSLAPSWTRSRTGHQYVDTNGAGEAIVGRLTRDTLSLTLRASWALTTTLSVQYYAMPYFSAGRYEHFYLATVPRAPVYADRFSETSYSGSDRFLYQQVRSNFVARWEYMPGSTLFLVWSREQGETRQDVGALSPGRDASSLLGSPSNDVVMLKAAHWLAL